MSKAKEKFQKTYGLEWECSTPVCKNVFVRRTRTDIYCAECKAKKYLKKPTPKNKEISKRKCQNIVGYKQSGGERVCGRPVVPPNRYLCPECFKMARDNRVMGRWVI